MNRLPSDFQYVSLQNECRDADQETLKSHPELLSFAEKLIDLTDTAALCELMDVVISVDTSLAHLAGALGKPVWVLLPFHPDWRWLLDREDSPWYPRAKLFRQDSAGDWDGVFERVKTALKKMCTHEPVSAS
jgi:ADP-heptose:LPS heptosyltransferase